MPVSAKSIESGIASATMNAARQLPKSNANRDDHDQQRALEQIPLHGVHCAVHQVGAIVERTHHRRLAAASLECGQFLAPHRAPRCGTVAARQHDGAADHAFRRRSPCSRRCETRFRCRLAPRHPRATAAPHAELERKLAISSVVLTRLLARMTICSPPISTIPPPTFSRVLANGVREFVQAQARAGQSGGIRHDDDLPCRNRRWYSLPPHPVSHVAAGLMTGNPESA
jgi:hypothetical protein